MIGAVLVGVGLLMGLFFVLSHDRTQSLLRGVPLKRTVAAGPPIGDGHLGELRAIFGEIARAVEQGQPCRYGDETGSILNRDALYAHGNGLVESLEGWDRAVERLGAAVAGLSAHLHARANALGIVEPTFFPNRIIGTFHGWIVERAKSGMLDQRIKVAEWVGMQRLDLICPAGMNDSWASLTAEPEEPAEEWWAKAQVLTGRVDDFFREAQESPEAREVADAHATLEGLKPSMLEQLRLGGKREVYAAVGDCPVCQVNQP